MSVNGVNIQQSVQDTPIQPPKPASWVPVTEHAINEPRKLRVVYVGAGFGGLTFAHKFKYESDLESFVDLCIYEKNADVGGTWLENQYPGIACDVPAHAYVFPFEPNPNWSQYYAGGAEIWKYIKKTTEKYNLDEKVVFNSRVVQTTWDEDTGKWKITIEKQGTTIHDEADILVNGSGVLNKWKWPSIPRLHDFKGTLMHSAAWKPDIDLSGKRIALIGNGSSAIQILPQIQPKAKSIVTYIRTPTWITSNFLTEFTNDGGNFKYSEEQKQDFRDNPSHLKEYRKKIEQSFNKMFLAFLQGHPASEDLQANSKKQMQDRLNNDPELCARLVPEFKVGCRRITPGDGYLEALQKDNVRIEYGEILTMTPEGIKTINGQDDVDVVICATGFDVSYRPPWKVLGCKGVSLGEKWSENPESYLGLCATEIPNYFVFNGPNAPIGHGSFLPILGWMTEYVFQWIRKMATEDIKSFQVKEDALEEYNTYSQEFLKRTVWASKCRSWYKNGKVDGKVTACYGGSIFHYKTMLEKFRSEDFDYTYTSKNRFAFMGNGLTIREEQDQDLAYYIQ